MNIGSPSIEAWVTHHGRFERIAYTELRFADDGIIICSTVVRASGFTSRDGFFRLYESRTFGAKDHEQVSSLCYAMDIREGKGGGKSPRNAYEDDTINR